MNKNLLAIIADIETVAKDFLELEIPVAFIGGSIAFVYLTQEGIRQQVRPTLDIDVVTDIKKRLGFYEIENKLRKIGYENDPEVICRFRKGDLILDIMPTDSSILGFTNRWYHEGLQNVEIKRVGTQNIQVFPLVYFIATKLEAFQGRGNSDYMTTPLT